MKIKTDFLTGLGDCVVMVTVAMSVHKAQSSASESSPWKRSEIRVRSTGNWKESATKREETRRVDPPKGKIRRAPGITSSCESEPESQTGIEIDMETRKTGNRGRPRSDAKRVSGARSAQEQLLKAAVKRRLQLRFDGDSPALRPFDDLRYDRTATNYRE